MEATSAPRHVRPAVPEENPDSLPFSSHLRGADLLNQPMLNKGTAFTEGERDRLGLHGLLPPHVETLDEQVVRAFEAFQRKGDDLERHIFLRALQDTNEVLFYRLLLDHLEEMIPIVYTPVVAQACQQFSHIYRRPRGLYIPYPLREWIPSLLQDRPFDEVSVIVVTDGERILGIGDQGAGGLGIPIGKLALYSLIGGIRPDRTLPVVLDVGTNNPERLRDPEYLGWRHERVTGREYLDLVDRFVRAVQHELPNVLLQWEDFAAGNARAILSRYRNRMLTFNDDIQGTGAVVLATVLSALRLSRSRLEDQEFVLLGAGSAAIGVADFLLAAFSAHGVPEAAARRHLWLVNRGGLVHSGRSDLIPEQRAYAQPEDRVTSWARTAQGRIELDEVVARAGGTVLIGLSTVGGAFTEAIAQEMGARVRRPVILPLSNPTANSEASPEDLLRWTDGRALIATGSPYLPVHFRGSVVPIAQCNNVYIFPAIGLGAVASRASRVTDGMLLAAAKALAELSPTAEGRGAPLLPPLRELPVVAQEIAVVVGLEAQRAGVAPGAAPAELRRKVAAAQWRPAYPDFSAHA